MGWLSDRFYLRGVALICSILIAPGEPLYYGQTPQPNQAGKPQVQSISSEQLDSLVAPIALYPDSLLAQVLGVTPAIETNCHWHTCRSLIFPSQTTSSPP